MFERAGDLVLQDARALHEFAQAKLALAQRLKGSSRPSDQQARKRLLQGAVGYLERVTQMDAPPTRHAWAWFNLGQARERLSAPRADIAEAYEKAVALLPREARFTEARARANARR